MILVRRLSNKVACRRFVRFYYARRSSRSHGPKSRASERRPVGVAIDENDTLFVANCGSTTVRRVSSEGDSQPFAESELFKCPNGITLDEAGFGAEPTRLTRSGGLRTIRC